MNPRSNQLQAFDRLLTIMDELRAQCPWDQKQTFETLRPLTIEETYELADAILEGDPQEIAKEVGDLMLHLVFYAKIGSEKQQFDVADVINQLCEKLIHRHPHIYGDLIVADEQEVKRNWEQLKLKEGNKGVLSGVPKGLPALVKATRIQEKAAGVGFDWPNADQVWAKVEEELAEFLTEVKRKDQAKAEEEFGDVLFSLINFARFQGIDPESSLERTNKKFIRRFAHMEHSMSAQQRTWSSYTLEELESLWQQAK
jgi:XTP/dITP diphosphohydrolase